MREIIILDTTDLKKLVNNVPITLVMNNGTKLEIVTEDYYNAIHKSN